MPGERGWRSPLPKWWVDAVHAELARRQLDKKQLARQFAAAGIRVSEMMVLRALHPDPTKRIATLETIEAISDAMLLPRPIVVAETQAQALELHRAIAFSDADAERLRIGSLLRDGKRSQSGADLFDEGSDGRTSRITGTLEAGGPRPPGARPKAVRGTSRAR